MSPPSSKLKFNQRIQTIRMPPEAHDLQSRALIQRLVLVFRAMAGPETGHEFPVEGRCAPLAEVSVRGMCGTLLCGQTAPWLGTTKSFTRILE